MCTPPLWNKNLPYGKEKKKKKEEEEERLGGRGGEGGEGEEGERRLKCNLKTHLVYLF